MIRAKASKRIRVRLGFRMKSPWTRGRKIGPVKILNAVISTQSRYSLSKSKCSQKVRLKRIKKAIEVCYLRGFFIFFF